MRTRNQLLGVEPLDTRIVPTMLGLGGMGTIIDAVTYAAEVAPDNPGTPNLDVDADQTVSPQDVIIAPPF